MPNQSDPSQNNPSTTVSVPKDASSIPSISPSADLPPLPPDFQASVNSSSQPVDQPANPVNNDVGSAAPIDLPPVISPMPKKKFGGGRVIATILGILVLVGGLGAGTVATFYPQLFSQKAYSCSYQGSSLVCTGSGAPTSTSRNDLESGTSQGLSSVTSTASTQHSNDAATVVCPSSVSCQFGCATQSSISGCSGVCTQCNTPSCAYEGSSQVCRVNGQVVSESASANDLEGATSALNNTGSTTNSGGHITSSTNPNCTCSGNNGDSCTGCNTGDIIAGQIYCADCSLGGGKTICAVGYHPLKSSGPGNGCVSSGGGGGGGGGGCTGSSCNTTTTESASCSSVTAYDASWNAVTSTQLSGLAVGTTVNFCVNGTATTGSFDIAQFTINGTQLAQTTTQRPSSTDLCQSYQIPAGTASFSVSAIIHNTELGWSI